MKFEAACLLLTWIFQQSFFTWFIWGFSQYAGLQAGPSWRSVCTKTYWNPLQIEKIKK